MKKEELWKYVLSEINMIRYYGYREDREKLDMNGPSIYSQIRSIGYAKVKTPLDLRCAGYICFEYRVGLSLDELVSLNERRNEIENKFTPLEIWILMFPEDRKMIYDEIIRINN